VGQVAEIGLGRIDLSVVPRRRVVDLARVGMRANATHLRRMRPHAKQLATLVGWFATAGASPSRSSKSGPPVR
jgi:hypothetical protein